MWEHHHHQAAHAAALQPSSSSFSFPSWSPYAGVTTALLGAGSAFATELSPSSDMRFPAAGEHVHGHPWSQHGEQSNGTCYRENFLDLLSSKNVTPEMFEDATASHYAAPALSGRFGAGSDVSPVKYELAGSPLFFGSTTSVHQGMNMVGCTPSYAYADNHQMKEGSDQQQQELATPAMASFLQQLKTNASVGTHASLDYSGIGGLDKICQESRAMEASPFSMRSLPDLSSFGGYRSTAESTSSVQPYMRSTNLSESSKQEQDIVPARSSGGGSGAASDRKKRPSEERTSNLKKPKQQEGSKASPPKQQVPKVKIGEKITALQQIVSPFGKTDTASVLFETIKYIKFLHEQVQLLSEPYTNSSRNKGNVVPWGDHAVETSKGEAENDLRDRGLCLVPVSWTPEVYRDGTAMDYWTPAYRGCLYR
uniref:BHLH domain-containing protein n=1 Tax=Arundo donax TaxID=35708 RepID=A0A0A9GH80_ARUDO